MTCIEVTLKPKQPLWPAARPAEAGPLAIAGPSSTLPPAPASKITSLQIRRNERAAAQATRDAATHVAVPIPDHRDVAATSCGVTVRRPAAARRPRRASPREWLITFQGQPIGLVHGGPTRRSVRGLIKSILQELRGRLGAEVNMSQVRIFRLVELEATSIQDGLAAVAARAVMSERFEWFANPGIAPARV